MKKISASWLLRLATKFEKMAQTMPDEPAQHYSDLLYSLGRLLKKEISPEELEEWVNKNATVLGDKARLYWYLDDHMNFSLIKCAEYDSGKEFIIYQQSTLPPEVLEQGNPQYDVVESGMLQASGSIPPLWLFGVKGISISNLPKEMAHENYLHVGLKELFGDADEEEILAFYNKYKTNINKLRTIFSTAPVRLGGGADGVAFSVGKNYVLKLFLDAHAYEEAQKAMIRLHKHPELAKTEAMIYDVGVLGEFKGKSVYFYIIERMKTVSSLDESIQQSINDIAKTISKLITSTKASSLKQYKEEINNPEKHAEIKSAVSILTGHIAMVTNASMAMDIADIDRELKLKDNWLELFVEEMIMKYLTSRTDLHMGNLGVTYQGELRYFDPAYKGWESRINL